MFTHSNIVVNTRSFMNLPSFNHSICFIKVCETGSSEEATEGE